MLFSSSTTQAETAGFEVANPLANMFSRKKSSASTNHGSSDEAHPELYSEHPALGVTGVNRTCRSLPPVMPRETRWSSRRGNSR